MLASFRVRRSRLFLILLALTLTSSLNHRVVAQQPAMRWDGLFELISGVYDYQPPWPGPQRAANAPSRTSRHAISGDGRWVIFDSDATNLGYSATGLYRHDRRTRVTETLLAGPAVNASISADGEHIAYEICEPYMRPDNQPICDVWTLDLPSWTMTPQSIVADGTYGNDHSHGGVLSGNGRFLVFTTKASNLSGGPTGIAQVMLRDRDADEDGIFDEPGATTFETITVDPLAAAAGDTESDTPEVSDDGRFVAFRSMASNLVAGDTNGLWDVFLRDRQSGQTARINVRPGGYQSPFAIDSAHISMTPDGRYLAFASADDVLVAAPYGDTNNASDLFVFDRQSFSLTRIDVGWGPPVAGGYVPGNGPTDWPTLSADGRYIAFQSAATNVEVPPAPGTMQVYVFDRVLEHSTRVSITASGQDPDADAVRPMITADASVAGRRPRTWSTSGAHSSNSSLPPFTSRSRLPTSWCPEEAARRPTASRHSRTRCGGRIGTGASIGSGRRCRLTGTATAR